MVTFPFLIFIDFQFSTAALQIAPDTRSNDCIDFQYQINVERPPLMTIPFVSLEMMKSSHNAI